MISRRSLLRGATLGSIVANLPVGVRIATAASGGSNNVIVFALLRGAMDGLNLVGPSDDADLIAARPAALRLTNSGSGAGLALANGPSANDWRLHPNAPELLALYQSGNLAFVHASGIPADSRSHFQMQAFLEHGVADPVTLGHANGWIGQYALSTGIAASTFALVSANQTLPPSMSGDNGSVSLPNPKQFVLGSTARGQFLTAAYAKAPGIVGAQGRTTIAAVNTFQGLHASYTAPPAGTYGTDSFATGLSVIAELIKINVGLQVAEVEYTAWDTHVNQQPRFAASVGVISKGLSAFFNDIANYRSNVTVVVASAFGRRVKSNADQGTDHGHGNVMMVLGGAVKGRRIYGTWQGLSPTVLVDGDVPITTDYRNVLAEVISGTRGNLPAGLFPGFVPGAPLGLFAS